MDAELDPAPATDKDTAHRTRPWHLLLVLPGILAAAIVVELMIERWAMDDRKFHNYVMAGGAFPNLVLDTFMLCLLLGAVVFLTGRFWVPTAAFVALGLVVAYANSVKLEVRNEPIYPSDLSVAGEPGFIGDVVSARTIVLLVLGVVAILALGLGAARLTRRRLPRLRRTDETRWWRLLLGLRMTAFLACVSLVVTAAGFNTPGNVWRRAYDHVGSDWKAWNQVWNYNRNGFVGGFLFNLRGPVMPEPPGYSRATMARVLQRYADRARAINATRDTHALDGVNIVTILSESFSDPTLLPGVRFDRDPLPRTRRLLGQTLSGRMLTQKVGGGTANMEFEVLTGLSLAQFSPQVTTPYQMLVPRYRTFPGAVRYFDALDRRTVAIHPYVGAFYKRSTAYPILGFDTFVDQTRMHERAHVDHSRYISDASAFDEVLRQLRTGDQPAFVNLVTMQNHYAWTGLAPHRFTVGGVPAKPAAQAARYARGINVTDQALATFLQQLQTLPEKTAVVFYGDHLPGLWPKGIAGKAGYRAMHQTPYFLWTNFKRLSHTPQPTTSPIYFLPQLFDQLDAPLPPFYALLRALHAQIPAMEQGHYIDAADNEVPEHALSRAAKALLRDYRLVQYDATAGRHYVTVDMFDLS